MLTCDLIFTGFEDARGKEVACERKQCRRTAFVPATIADVSLLRLKCKSKHRGLGDTAASVIDAVTLGFARKCGGCKKRQKKLNKIAPAILYGPKT